MQNPLKIAVVGVGHLGQHHARIYRDLPNVTLIAVCDTNLQQVKKIAKKYEVASYVDYRDLVKKIDVVSIATPTFLHYEICRFFLKNNIHVFVEKPITEKKEDAADLIYLSQKNNLKLQVGHIERFNPVMVNVIDRNIEPLYIETKRYSPFRFRSGDIGVVLDLMIHDIDLVCALIKSPVKDVCAVGTNILGKNEDIANARIEFENGCVANLNASRVSQKAIRTMNIFSMKSYISIDLHKKTGTIYHKPKDSNILNYQQHAPRQFEQFPFEDYFFDRVLQQEKISPVEYEPLQRELEYFINCVVENIEPLVSGKEGLIALTVAQMICDDIRSCSNIS